MNQSEHMTKLYINSLRYFNSRAVRALKYIPHLIRTIFFVRCIPKVSRVGLVLRVEIRFSAHLKFYRTGAGKETFHTRNDTDKANFRFTAEKNFLLVKVLEKKLENLLIITVDCKISCKILTQMKLSDVSYRLLLYFINFREDIL